MSADEDAQKQPEFCPLRPNLQSKRHNLIRWQQAIAYRTSHQNTTHYKSLPRCWQ